MVVHSRDDCVIVAVPRYHGDFGFEVAFLFARRLNTERREKVKQGNTDRHLTCCCSPNGLDNTVSNYIKTIEF